jgi:hypothetical protein
MNQTANPNVQNRASRQPLLCLGHWNLSVLNLFEIWNLELGASDAGASDAGASDAGMKRRTLDFNPR